MRALIVEDDEFFRSFLVGLLSSALPELEIHEAANVTDGRRIALERSPGLIFMDIRLPDGNGIELTRELRKELPTAVIVVCSINDTPEYREASIASGATYFLSKRAQGFERAWDSIQQSMLDYASLSEAG